MFCWEFRYQHTLLDFCGVEILVKEIESSMTTEEEKYGSCYWAESTDSGEEGSLTAVASVS